MESQQDVLMRAWVCRCTHDDSWLGGKIYDERASFRRFGAGISPLGLARRCVLVKNAKNGSEKVSKYFLSSPRHCVQPALLYTV